MWGLLHEASARWLSTTNISPGLLSREVVGGEDSLLCWVLPGRLLTTDEDVWVVGTRFHSFLRGVSVEVPGWVAMVSGLEVVDEDLGKNEYFFMRMMIIMAALSRPNQLPWMLINEMSWGSGLFSNRLLVGMITWMEKAMVWPFSLT